MFSFNVLLASAETTDCQVGVCADVDVHARGSHQSFGHGCFVLSGKVLLQSQDDTVGDDGGEDHVLERSGRLKLRMMATV